MKHCVVVVQPLRVGLRAADLFERILSEIMQLLFKLLCAVLWTVCPCLKIIWILRRLNAGLQYVISIMLNKSQYTRYSFSNLFFEWCIYLISRANVIIFDRNFTNSHFSFSFSKDCKFNDEELFQGLWYPRSIQCIVLAFFCTYLVFGSKWHKPPSEHWQCPSFPQVPWSVHVILALQNTKF